MLVPDIWVRKLIIFFWAMDCCCRWSWIIGQRGGASGSDGSGLQPDQPSGWEGKVPGAACTVLVVTYYRSHYRLVNKCGFCFSLQLHCDFYMFSWIYWLGSSRTLKDS